MSSTHVLCLHGFAYGLFSRILQLPLIHRQAGDLPACVRVEVVFVEDNFLRLHRKLPKTKPKDPQTRS
ncbi:MAG: hypothetical protein ACYTBX_12735 [Planctomycetota bacterium]